MHFWGYIFVYMFCFFHLTRIIHTWKEKLYLSMKLNFSTSFTCLYPSVKAVEVIYSFLGNKVGGKIRILKHL